MSHVFLHRPRASKPGYVFLISVLVIGAIGAATATSLMLLGWAAEQNGVAVAQSHQAFEYAQACAERTIRRLRGDVTYAGGDTITFDDGLCTIGLIGGYGYEDRTVCISGESGESLRRLELSIGTLYPSVVISLWREATDFTLCPDA